MDTGYEIQPKQRIWIQDMGYNLNKGYGYRIQPKQRIWIQDMGYNLNKGYGYRIWDTT